MSRIALLLPDLEAGGAQRVMLMLAKEFSARGHSVDLILLKPSGPLLANIPNGVKIIDLKIQSFGLGQVGLILSSAIRLASWMKRKSPDVFLSTITGANLVALLARKISSSSVRIVIREAVTLDNVRGSLRLRAMRWLYPQADTVIALSPFMREELIVRIGVSSDQINCITNPVDVEFIRKQAQASISHPWLNNDELKVIVAVGRLIPQKDYGTLLRAFALLQEAAPVRLIIVGEGPERKMLEQSAVDIGIDDIVGFVGFDANPWRWMARSDLFVLSSRWEGHPNVLLEAMALNLPIVTTEYDVSVLGLAAEYGFAVAPSGNQIVLAKVIEEQLHVIGKQRKYSISTEVIDSVVACYLGVLDCNDPFLSE